jgi:hypothetical protein
VEEMGGRERLVEKEEERKDFGEIAPNSGVESV